LPGFRIHVLDTTLEPSPLGVPGEVWVEAPSAKRQRTGDRARVRTDGRIEHLGRLDARVLIRGARIEPEGVAAILSTHPAVSECAVIARLDEQGEAYLLAAVVRRATGETATSLSEFLSRRLPQVSVPRRVIEVAALPRQRDGGLDRRALAALDDTAGAESGFVSPRTPTEIVLAEIVAELLGRARIGLADDLYLLGLRSLQAARLGVRIAEAFGTRLSIATILTNSTVARLAEIIARPGEGTTSGLVLLRQGSKRSPVFIMPDLAGLFGHARRLAERIVSGHPVYSICLPERNGEPYTFEQLEDLARYCVGRIAASRPAAECHLVGYSFGGTLAYEVARQLHAAGFAVGVVAIIDVEARLPRSRSLSQAAKTAGTLLVEGAHFVRHDLPRGRWIRTVRGRLRRFVRGMRGEELLWVDELVAALPIWDLPPAYREVARTHLQSVHFYEEQPYAGRITLIRSRDAERRNVVNVLLRDLGWSRVAAGGAEVRVVPGDHYNIMELPALDTVGEHLTDALGCRD
jgi:aspartate racemase